MKSIFGAFAGSRRLVRPLIRPLSWATLTVTVLGLSGQAQCGSFGANVCPTCKLSASSISSLSLSTDRLNKYLTPVLQQANQPAVVTFTNPNLASFNVNWNGMGELPGAFQRPWELEHSSNYDPSFVTPYWNSTDGVIWNSPMAPWNRFPLGGGEPMVPQTFMGHINS